MRSSLFRTSSRGPLKIQKTGSDRYTACISLPKDQDGRTARACPDAQCSPGYFKVKSGTGITGAQTHAFCPYCRHAAEPEAFATRQQRRYAEALLMREAHEGIGRIVKETLGLGRSGHRRIDAGLVSINMTYEPDPRPTVRSPYEEPLRRDVVCPHCGLDHSVYGLATWCPDCGVNIFLTHVDAELSVVEAMLGDVDRRRETFGPRIAIKDLENGLEDTVSIFEAVLKIIVRRAMCHRGVSPTEVDRALRQAGNCFQNIDRTEMFLSERLGLAALPGLSAEERNALHRIFAKRHPITHNLAIVDRKHFSHAPDGPREGRDVEVLPGEITQAIALSKNAFGALMLALLS